MTQILSNRELERYNRQTIISQIDLKGQEQLKKSKVLIIGVGGLGSSLAINLTGAGIGHLGVIDGDEVSLHNLHRQILYTEDEIGKNKALCAQKRLSEMNSDIVVEAYPEMISRSNAREIISKYDIIVDGCDNFSTRYLVSDLCQELKKCYVYGAICECQGQVAVFTHKKDISYRTLFPESDELNQQGNPSKGVIVMTPALIASVQSLEVVKQICGFSDTLENKLWSIDLLTMQALTLSLDE